MKEDNNSNATPNNKRLKIVIKDDDTLLYRVYTEKIGESPSDLDVEDNLEKRIMAMRRMKEIDDRLHFNEILLYHDLSCLSSICAISIDIGRAIENNIIVKANRREAHEDNQAIEKILAHKAKSKLLKHEYIPYIVNELCDKVDYIDWDKFLLLTAYEILSQTQNKDGVQEINGKSTEEILTAIYGLIKDKNAIISAKTTNSNGIERTINYSCEELKYSIEGIKENRARIELERKQQEEQFRRKCEAQRRKLKEEKKPELKREQENYRDLYTYEKIRTFMSIDKDYEYSLTKDGYIIFKFPNHNKIIIERVYYTSKSGVKKVAVTSKTYILNVDDYQAAEIVSEDNEVNLENLEKLYQAGKCESYGHTVKWKRNIFESFGLEYTPEKITEGKLEEIDKILGTLRFQLR